MPRGIPTGIPRDRGRFRRDRGCFPANTADLPRCHWMGMATEAGEGRHNLGEAFVPAGTHRADAAVGGNRDQSPATREQAVDIREDSPPSYAKAVRGTAGAFDLLAVRQAAEARFAEEILVVGGNAGPFRRFLDRIPRGNVFGTGRRLRVQEYAFRRLLALRIRDEAVANNIAEIEEERDEQEEDLLHADASEIG